MESTTVSFVIGKSRLAPMKAISIPRLELAAAALAVKLAQLVKKELQCDLPVCFYTDSMIVLYSIRNESKRFPVFVANRISLIREYSSQDQWQHVPSELNPADDATRGLTPEQLLTSKWLSGPNFLKSGVEEWSEPDLTMNEMSFLTCMTDAVVIDDSVSKLMSYYSEWSRLKHAVAFLLRLRRILQERARNNHNSSLGQPLTPKDLADAEVAILKWLQKSVYTEEMATLQEKNKSVSKSSSLFRLEPFLHEGLIRIKGRISESELPFQEKELCSLVITMLRS